MNDTRNLLDQYKGMSESDIITQLDLNGVELEIAIENTLRDYNMGTIVWGKQGNPLTDVIKWHFLN